MHKLFWITLWYSHKNTYVAVSFLREYKCKFRTLILRKSANCCFYILGKCFVRKFSKSSASKGNFRWPLAAWKIPRISQDWTKMFPTRKYQVMREKTNSYIKGKQFGKRFVGKSRKFFFCTPVPKFQKI